MKRTGAEIITALLERQSVSTVAGIPGGSNLPLYDALRDSPIRHVLARHEQGAGFIAQGMARSTGRAAVCLATSGPGATNLLTAIADAHLDSVPIVAITGQVPSSMIGTDAFQEVDTYGLTLPITKHNFLVRSAGELLEVIPAAFEAALSGRPGPVAVDIPKDVQLETLEFDEWPEPGMRKLPPLSSREDVEALAHMIAKARRPVLLAGGGVIASSAADELKMLAEKSSLPVASTLAGLGAFPCDSPLSLGMLGMHGARATNTVLEEADLLIAVGARFDDRATGRAEEFCRRAAIAHVDIDPSEIGKIKEANIAIAADAGTVLRALLPLVPQDDRESWMDRLARIGRENPGERPSEEDIFQPAALLGLTAELAGPEAFIATDVGQHQMWVAQHYPVGRPRALLTSGGLGTMGFGLPAAIGAALADTGRRVVCISGDGSLLMNIQELATLAELDLDVKVIVMNNGHLGLVRQQQELFFEGRYYASRFDRTPDFPALAAAFGIKGIELEGADDPGELLREAFSWRGPVLVNAPVHHERNVYPMVPPGGANREMIGGELTHA
jgi:acetolactate synthase-1/2/3 large subunit